jgi:hypothetical protein
MEASIKDNQNAYTEEIINKLKAVKQELLSMAIKAAPMFDEEQTALAYLRAAAAVSSVIKDIDTSPF